MILLASYRGGFESYKMTSVKFNRCYSTGSCSCRRLLTLEWPSNPSTCVMLENATRRSRCFFGCWFFLLLLIGVRSRFCDTSTRHEKTLCPSAPPKWSFYLLSPPVSREQNKEPVLRKSKHPNHGIIRGVTYTNYISLGISFSFENLKALSSFSPEG